jgi:nucleotide-binding universal stress UspA family protein
MTKAIIVPLDGSGFAERALPYAAEISRRTAAQVVLMTSRFGGVIENPEAYLRDAGDRAHISDAREVVVSDRFVVPGLEVLADEFPDPAICMSTRGHFDVGHWLFGSTAAELISRSKIPMLFVGPAVDTETPPRFDTALICTDGSDCADAVLPSASEWVQSLRLRPEVVQVLDPEIRLELDAHATDVVESATVHRVADDLSRSSGLEVGWEVLHGDDAAHTIVERAIQMHTSIIAMATHGRTGWARIAAGSVATSVVHSSPCPVLLVRPNHNRLNSQAEIAQEQELPA